MPTTTITAGRIQKGLIGGNGSGWSVGELVDAFSQLLEAIVGRQSVVEVDRLAQELLLC